MASQRLKALKFDMEKDWDKFETWKLKWADLLISSNINLSGITGARVKQKKAALTEELSEETEVDQWSRIQPCQHHES